MLTIDLGIFDTIMAFLQQLYTSICDLFNIEQEAFSVETGDDTVIS
ncbi:MAG: hypothetical protein R3Y27_05065 [Clostridia bacterium]